MSQTNTQTLNKQIEPTLKNIKLGKSATKETLLWTENITKIVKQTYLKFVEFVQPIPI